MDNFDYKSYLKSGKIYGDVNETKILKESEEISENSEYFKRVFQLDNKE